MTRTVHTYLVAKNSSAVSVYAENRCTRNAMLRMAISGRLVSLLHVCCAHSLLGKRRQSRYHGRLFVYVRNAQHCQAFYSLFFAFQQRVPTPLGRKNQIACWCALKMGVHGMLVPFSRFGRSVFIGAHTSETNPS